MSLRRTRRIDPETGSYVMTDGAWEYDETGFSQLHQATMTELGTVPADDGMGNRLFTRETISSRTEEETKKDMADAAQHVIDDGIVDSFRVVFVDVNDTNPSRIDYGWTWKVGGESYTYEGSLAIGTGA